jgi:hypothetical protein
MGKTADSFEHLRRKIKELRRGGPRILDVGLKQIGEEIMTDVKASRPGKGVPKDTGALSETGVVEGPVDHVVTLAFGGDAAPYALVQHEKLTFHHDLGEARYLVRGLERWRPDGASVQRAMKELAGAVTVAASKAP